MGCGTPGTAFPTVGICADSPGCGGDRWGVVRNGTEAVPYIGFSRIRRGFFGIGGVCCGTVITVPYTGVCGFALIR